MSHDTNRGGLCCVIGMRVSFLCRSFRYRSLSSEIDDIRSQYTWTIPSGKSDLIEDIRRSPPSDDGCPDPRSSSHHNFNEPTNTGAGRPRIYGPQKSYKFRFNLDSIPLTEEFREGGTIPDAHLGDHCQNQTAESDSCS